MSNLKTSILYLPRPASKYPGCYPLHFEKHLPDILETDNFIHLFSGSANLGFRVDIKSELSPDLVSDVHSMPLKNNSFDGGMPTPHIQRILQLLYTGRPIQNGLYGRKN